MEPALAAAPKTIKRRPAIVTLTALGVLIPTVVNLLRCVLAWRLWGFLAGLPQVSPAYQFLTGLGWGLVGLMLFFGMWAGWLPALKLLRLAAPAYAAYVWFDRLVMAPAGQQANALFVLLATIVLLVFILWVTFRPRVRTFFGEPYERK